MTRLLPVVTALMVTLICTPAIAADKSDKRMNDAIDVINDFTRIPEKSIPRSILRNAYGVAVFPGVIKAGFMVGGRYGKGVLMVRQDDGGWSNPAFVSLGGGGFGWQIGAQSTDLVLVFKDRRSIDNIVNGKLTLGGDIAAAAGPVGRQSSAATDERLKAEIYSYSRNRGLFAGISLEGAWIGMDTKSNESYYGSGMTPEQILTATNMATPMSAGEMVDIMSSVSPASGVTSTPARRTAEAAPSAPAEPDEGVRTFAIEPIDEFGDETTF